MRGSLNYKQIPSFSRFPHRFYHVEASVGPPQSWGFCGLGADIVKVCFPATRRRMTTQRCFQRRKNHLHIWFHWTLQPNFARVIYIRSMHWILLHLQLLESRLVTFGKRLGTMCSIVSYKEVVPVQSNTVRATFLWPWSLLTVVYTNKQCIPQPPVSIFTKLLCFT